MSQYAVQKIGKPVGMAESLLWRMEVVKGAMQMIRVTSGEVGIRLPRYGHLQQELQIIEELLRASV